MGIVKWLGYTQKNLISCGMTLRSVLVCIREKCLNRFSRGYLKGIARHEPALIAVSK